jgi:PKD repeat protein
VTDAAGVATKAQSVTVAPPPVPTASFTSTCGGLTCSFNGSGSTAQSGATYSWNWGDGTAAGSGVTPSHTFAANGTYTVTLSVTDVGGTGTISRAVTVLYVPPPTPSFTYNCTYLVCTFDASGSVAQTNATYAWRWGDGTSNGSGVTASHTYTSAGTRSVRLTVTDAGGSRTLTQSVTTTAGPNQPPVVNAGLDRTIRVSQLPFRLSASFTDADGRSPWAYVITWGDGTQSTGTRTSTGSFSVSHSYARVAGTYVVGVTVTDAAGAAGSDTMTLTVTP